MSVTNISLQAGSVPSSNFQMERISAGMVGKQGVEISFQPQLQSNTPMSQIGSGIMDTLRNFEQTRVDNREAMKGAGVGPASSLDSAKAELLSGPASIQPASGTQAPGPASNIGYDDAVSAMTRSFDYAIETQLIVKTGSQFSSSASSLMRGQ